MKSLTNIEASKLVSLWNALSYHITGGYNFVRKKKTLVIPKDSFLILFRNPKHGGHQQLRNNCTLSVLACYRKGTRKTGLSSNTRVIVVALVIAWDTPNEEADAWCALTLR